MSGIVGLLFWKYFSLVLLVSVLTVIFEHYSGEFNQDTIIIYPKQSDAGRESVQSLTPEGTYYHTGSGMWHKVDNSTKLYTFSAYFDERMRTDGPSLHEFGQIRVLGFEGRAYNINTAITYCCFGYNKNDGGKFWSPSDGRRKISERTLFRSYNVTKFHEHSYFTPVMYSCALQDSRVPTSVFLTTKQYCFAKDNNIKKITTESPSVLINHSPKPRIVHEFSVCVHSPLFNMKDYELVASFVELNRILGAGLFTFYIYSASDSVRKLLQSYQVDELVDVVSEWGENIPKTVRYYGQDLSVQDCLFRNMNRAKYLFFIDLDEVVFPFRHRTWNEMMTQYLDKGNTNEVSAFHFPHVAMFSKDRPYSQVGEEWNHTRSICNSVRSMGVPRFLSYTVRSRKVSLNKGKLLVKPRDIRSLAIHKVSEFWERGKRTLTVDSEVASLLHYRLDGLDKFSKRTTYFDKLRNIAPKLLSNIEKRLCQLKL